MGNSPHQVDGWSALDAGFVPLSKRPPTEGERASLGLTPSQAFRSPMAHVYRNRYLQFIWFAAILKSFMAFVELRNYLEYIEFTLAGSLRDFEIDRRSHGYMLSGYMPWRDIS